jgi:glycogen phosphorylase
MNPATSTPLDSQCQNPAIEDDRTGLSVETLKRALADNLFYVQGRFREIATKNDLYMALAYTVSRSFVATLDKYDRNIPQTEEA